MARPDPTDLFQAYPFEQWHEDFGDVLWWRLPVEEPPYCGTPNDLGRQVMVTVSVGNETLTEQNLGDVGGWPFGDGGENNLVWTILPGAIRWP